MNAIQWMRDKLRIGKHDEAKDGWPSIVFLLREPILPTPEVAKNMGQAAWGAAAPVELVSTIREHSYLLRADLLFFAVHAAHARYEVGRLQLSQVQQQRWDEHTAWLSVDMPQQRALKQIGRTSWSAAYKSLMFFVFKHWSPNCLALYFPAEGVTVPNMGGLAESIRWSRRNGIDLSFLKLAQWCSDSATDSALQSPHAALLRGSPTNRLRVAQGPAPPAVQFALGECGCRGGRRDRGRDRPRVRVPQVSPLRSGSRFRRLIESARRPQFPRSCRIVL